MLGRQVGSCGPRVIKLTVTRTFTHEKVNIRVINTLAVWGPHCPEQTGRGMLPTNAVDSWSVRRRTPGQTAPQTD